MLRILALALMSIVVQFHASIAAACPPGYKWGVWGVRTALPKAGKLKGGPSLEFFTSRLSNPSLVELTVGDIVSIMLPGSSIKCTFTGGGSYLLTPEFYEQVRMNGPKAALDRKIDKYVSDVTCEIAPGITTHYRAEISPSNAEVLKRADISISADSEEFEYMYTLDVKCYPLKNLPAERRWEPFPSSSL
ncbi:MAG: hypothetical protein J5J00_11135 [Deltaproteobacteria bacterium]|nr:hypothetical protein [Deltaproteobacteria bacterium]